MKSKFTRVILLLLPLFSFVHSNSQSISFNLVWKKTADVTTIKFTPNSKLLITGGVHDCSYCGQLKVWRAKDSMLLATITKEALGTTNAVDISNDSRIIISGHGGVYCSGGGEGGDCKPAWGGESKHLINGKEKKLLYSGDIVYAIAYSPDNKIIAAGTGYNNTGEIRIYDSNYNLLRVLPGHKDETDGLAFTPDGKYLVSGGKDGTVKVWNYANGTLVRTMTHGDYLNGGTNINVDVSPDGKYIASAGRGYNMVTKIWRVSDGALIHVLPVNGSYGTNVAKFSADGNYVVSGTQQYKTGPWLANIFVWRLSDGALTNQITDRDGAPFGGIRAMAFSSDKKYFAHSIIGILKVFAISYSNPVTSESGPQEIHFNAPFKSTAYPNPFKSFITISYSLPFQQHVLITIHDAAGITITVLKNDNEDAGTHRLLFNAEKLNTGMYFYKIHTQEFVETRKLIARN